jgi:hypothetical protein
MTCEPSRKNASLPMELPSISSAEASPARTFPTPAVEPVSPESALAYSTKWLGFLANWSQSGCCWKTSQLCLLAGLETFSEPWPRSGMMLSGTAYQLPPLAHLTDETASGYWPTPNAAKVSFDMTLQCSGDGRSKPNKLGWAVALWPTPNARTLGGGEYQDPEKIKLRWSKGRQKNLSEAVKLFPTPTSRDWKDGSAPRFREGVQQFDTLGRAVGGQLNPQWVEWLMGFPVGWTDLSS